MPPQHAATMNSNRNQMGSRSAYRPSPPQTPATTQSSRLRRLTRTLTGTFSTVIGMPPVRTGARQSIPPRELRGKVARARGLGFQAVRRRMVAAQTPSLF
jgi:hypothetical protein